MSERRPILFAMASHEVRVPDYWSERIYVDGNTARQLLIPAAAGTLAPYEDGWAVRTSTGIHRLRERGATPEGMIGLEASAELMKSLPAAIEAKDLRWVPRQQCTGPDDVRDSLAGSFTLAVEDVSLERPGLRLPQAGAWHATLAHWSTGTSEPATVVLPTGTGKTETMVALLASERLTRLLIVVPSQRLRSQIAEVFETYGVLPAVGVLGSENLRPVVGRIEHHFENVANLRAFADRCNVIVTTPPALNASGQSVRAALVARCSHLFVDEAHHVSAKTWSDVRDAFAAKPVVQFTATPYRSDGERLGGRVIYSFPLGEAQRRGYFQKISYVSVVALEEPDRAVALEAIKRLRADLENGFDHLIMARVNRIGRARDAVQPLYKELAPDLEPQVLHSDLSAPERRAALEAIEARRSRIVVCVDMLGEGFDFPELKVAALHDPHRSLGVALQFIGRFARSRSDLGTATAVVARPEPGYDPRLRALYAERNEWDSVIELLATQAIAEVRELEEFETGFEKAEQDEISIHVLRPKMSTVVYETDRDDWDPHRLSDLFSDDEILVAPTINADERVAWMVVERHEAVRWADLRSIEDVAHHLHVLHWDRERQLVYINSSDLDSLHEDLAEAVCGETAKRITGDPVYRALADINRPVPTNVGVINLRNRSRRFSMHVGTDVYEGFSVAEQQTRSNTNIFVFGYSEGERVTMGAARKGRIWSQQAAKTILEWVGWCRELGPKLQDTSIELAGLLRSFVRPKPLEVRPPLMPLAIDWPWIAFAGMGESTKLEAGRHRAQLIDVDLVLTDQSEVGPIRFDVVGEGFSLPYEARVEDGAISHRALSSEAIIVWERAPSEPLSEYLDREGTTIWFENEVLVEGPDVLFELDREQPPIDLQQLVTIDWSGVDITRESQGPERDPATVQARAADVLIAAREWDVVIDDDGTGEIADLVALSNEEERVLVQLVHCKYSSKDFVGGRVEDLYEVCGQAHRSAHQRQDPSALIRNLIRRERKRRTKAQTGLLHGSDEDLLRFGDHVRLRRTEVKICIAQPGLSKSAAQAAHLRLLGCADVYVKEIANGAFDVWCSD